MRRSPVRCGVFLLVLLAFVAYGGFRIWPRVSNWLERDRTDEQALRDVNAVPIAATPVTASDRGWPQWRGPDRDGRAPESPFRSDWSNRPPVALWQQPCGGGYSQPVVVKGRVYLFSKVDEREVLDCRDASTGNLLWSHSADVDYGGIGYGAGPRATPTIHEETIYTYGATGRLTAITLEGKERWHQDTQVLMEAPVPQWGFASSPLIDGELVIVQPGGRKGSIAAFDRSSGELRWAAGRNPNGYSSPMIATLGGVRQIVAVTGDAILGLNPAEGAILWSHPWVTQFEGNIATPVIAGDLVFVSSGYQKGCVLLKIDGVGPGAVKKTEVYFRKNRVMANHHSTCVLRDGFLYGYDDQRLACVNLRTGQRPSDWEATDDNGRIIGKGSVTLVGDKLLGLTEAGTLFLAAADPKEFRFLGKLETGLRRECWAAPVVCEGRIYLRDSEKLIVLDVRP